MFMYLPPGAQGPDKRRLELLAAIGSRIGMAIDNMRLQEKTRELSLHDPLTGLANRRMNSMELEKQFARARRSGSPLSVIMFDLDNFKDYNDTYGHSAGDALLVRVANIIHDEIREIDLAVRYGGEEFLILLPDTGLWAGMEVAERIRSRVAATPFPCNGDRGSITRMTLSGGVAVADETVDSAERLIDSADSAMYGAKQHGRNRIEASLARKTGWLLP
jgi:diguanylate cyclase (GGDEF)-like protein